MCPTPEQQPQTLTLPSRFIVGVFTCWYHSPSPVYLHIYTQPSVTTINLKLEFLVKTCFFFKQFRWNAAVAKLTKAFDLASSPEKWFRNAIVPLRAQLHSLLLTGLLLIGVLCSLANFASLLKLLFYLLVNTALMYWSSHSVVSFGLPDRALDTTDTISAKCFRVPGTAFLENFSLALIWFWETTWLLKTLAKFWCTRSHYDNAT